MGREALHSDSIKIEQKPDMAFNPVGPDGLPQALERESEIVRAEQLPSDDYAAELLFNEEPVTIRIEPSSEKNAASAHPVRVNGQGAEVLLNGRWIAITFLPVGRPLTIKRKYLAVIASAKLDTVHTEVREPESETPNNVINRYTSAVMSFSVIEDKNPRGAAWLQELRRRNF